MTDLSIKFFLIAVLAQAFNLQMNYYSLAAKAKVANLIFNGKLFLGGELPRIGAIFSIILIAEILLPYVPPSWGFWSSPIAVLLTGALLGYAGTDVAMRFFGSWTKRLNAAIDAKTTQADEANNTVNAPTPAAPIKKTPPPPPPQP